MIHPAKTILVTGSNSGFGRLIIETLARQGHIVFAGIRGLTGKNAAAADEIRVLAEQEQLRLHVVEIDVTDETLVLQAISHVISVTGRLDVVVNNAGVSYTGPLEAFTIEQVQQQFNTNVFGTWRVNKAALPQMRAQKSGLLLQVGSISGLLATPFLGLYGASKFALEGLTESYRYELATLGIDSVIVEPGTYPTTLSANRHYAADREHFAPYDAALKNFMSILLADNQSSTPANPQEVADLIANIIDQPAGARSLHTAISAGITSPFIQTVKEEILNIFPAYRKIAAQLLRLE